jgi:hypothetical protein
MTVAREIAREMRSPAIEADPGAYYLGATTPDIRALTRDDREHTHFFRLDDFGEQSGVRRLFDEQPALRDTARLDASTVAFMAGYLSHLVLDEDYICQIYRPCFGAQSDVADDPLANVIDRLLQYRMEMKEREDAGAIDEIRQALEATAGDVAVDFIAREAIRDWRNLQLEIIGRPPSVARMLGRHLHAVGITDEREVASFLEGRADSLLDATMQRIGAERVRCYLADSRRRATEAMREYLS